MKIKSLISTVFYISVGLCLFFTVLPKTENINYSLLANLLNGSDKGFETLGSEYEPFVSYLPKTGAISFIMDYPFSNYARTVEQLYTAQSYLVPLIINPGTEEKIAILYCSSDEIADHRLNQSQYKPLARLGAGKGIALKQS